MIGWYIGGGVACIALLAILVGVMASSGGGGGKSLDVKFGLSKGSRQRLFQEMIEAVDKMGETKAKSTEWPKIAAEYKVELPIAQKILDEGFDAGWVQPSIDHYTAEAKANHVEWIKRRGQGLR